jgi:HD-like signal output (HDOD) protein
MRALSEEKLKQAREIVRKVQIPAQPAIIFEISKVLKQEHPEFRKIAELVSRDAALVIRVLHIINSPFFGLSRKVESITQALTLMGLDNFYKVVMTACLREALGGTREVNRQFWDHSQRAAVAAENIARITRTALALDNISPDQAYLAGLFHDSGIPVLMDRLPRYQPMLPLALSHESGVTLAEDELVGTDHCLIGNLVARSWSMPDRICMAILHHHAIAPHDTPAFPRKLVAVVQLADYIAYGCDYSLGATDRIVEREWDVEDWCELHAPFIGELYLGPEDVRDLKSEITERLLAP